MTRRLLCALALCCVASLALARAQARTSFVVLTSAGEYPGETYTQGPQPPARVVYFTGERVAVDVSVANWGPESGTVAVSSAGEPSVRLELRSAGMLRPAAWQLQPEGWVDQLTGSVRRPIPATLRLDPGDAVRWRALLDTSDLPPALYTISSTVSVQVPGGAPRAEQPDLIVELRARDAAEPAELARRAAEWLAAEGDPLVAWAATEELERVYADSVAVHLIRSRIAERQQDAARSRRELDEALAYMRRDRDRLFRRYARPGQIEDLIDSLAP